MRVWKALVLIVPAGLALGMVGGNLARPVMQQRAVAPGQPKFETRAQRYGSAQPSPVLPEGPTTYVGGYSYRPDGSDWSRGHDDGDWPSADTPLPTMAELDARQVELLADPDIEFAVSPPDRIERAVDAAQVARAPNNFGPEPRAVDGQLPAIW